ncbi:MAG: ansA 2, partial [Verrucomicrobia bacterium]|nr:ansA 2 [Verrucomicrobiota bacterium]
MRSLRFVCVGLVASSAALLAGVGATSAPAASERSERSARADHASRPSARSGSADDLPGIAVFCGPTATILNTDPPVTSRKAREKYGLPPLHDWFGRGVTTDTLYYQRLAAPVTVYIDQFSAHPLERDAAALFAPPDGYLDAANRFSKVRQGPADRPVYEVELRPEDGLYPLPYMARRADGSAWDDFNGANGGFRQTFFPDASRLFEELERSGSVLNGNISGRAHLSFYRIAPSGGYTQGLSAAERTDVGAGDIPPERAGVDFFPYGYVNAVPPRAMLASITNSIEQALAGGAQRGAIWLEGSPRVEDTLYWLSLVIDTDCAIVGTVAQRPNHRLAADSHQNLVDAVDFILSDVWRDVAGHNRVGSVLVQDQQVFAAREVIKIAPRPGGF